MSNLWDQLKERGRILSANWASFVALGSFAIYVLGYLVVRFHLTVFGVGTDLAVLDERYLFAGAKFLVYLFSTIPILVLVGFIAILIVLLAIPIVYLVSLVLHQLFPKTFRLRLGLIRKGWGSILILCSHPHWILKTVRVESLSVVGVLLALLVIQFVMRQCFLFHDLLLAPNPLPAPIKDHWFTALLLDKTGNSQYYYFSGLVAVTALSLGIFVKTKMNRRSSRARGVISLQGLLLLIQFLFLPINYGILVFDKAVPKVESLGGQQELVKCQSNGTENCQEAWLIWEGTSGEAYLVRDWKHNQESRRLITLPIKDRKRIEIIKSDYVLAEIFQ